MRNCINLSSQKLNKGYSNFDIPLTDYYGIKSIGNLAADIDIFLLRFLKTSVKKDEITCLKKDLICFNFKDTKTLRILGRILEKSKGTFAKNQAIKRIYQTYIRSLRKAYEKIISL